MRTRGLVAVGLVLLVLLPRPAAAIEPLQDMQYGLVRVGAARAWQVSRGAGVAIAVIDTGVDLQHEDLKDRIVAGHDFVDGDDIPQDVNGHGTHVAGVAAASENGRGIVGVAPAAMIIPMRVLDETGTGVESDVASAVDAAVLRAAERGLRLVINMSFTDVTVTGGATSERITEAVRRAWFAGAVIVAAVGNENLPFSDFPAAGPNVIAVGSTDDRDRRSAFSNKGPGVVAPGERIVSTFWDPDTPDDHAVYASGTGTSMATPIVAGVAALLLGAGRTNQQVVQAIHETADDLGPAGPDEEFGFGMVNAPRALGLVSTGSVAPRPVVPGAASTEGRFEEINPAAVPEPAPAVDEPGPPKAVPGGIAAALVGLAYLASRMQAAESLASSRRRR